MSRAEHLARVLADGFRLVEDRRCPYCGADALCIMPLHLLIREVVVHDADTNIVCHPLLGGCNQGFQAQLTHSEVN